MNTEYYEFILIYKYVGMVHTYYCKSCSFVLKIKSTIMIKLQFIIKSLLSELSWNRASYVKCEYKRKQTLHAYL